MQKSFHMAFTTLQRDVHHHMHTEGNELIKVNEAELTDFMIQTMDAAQEQGVDLARSVLDKLNSTKRAQRKKVYARRSKDETDGGRRKLR